MVLSKINKFVIYAYDRGYRIVNNKVLNPNGKILKTWTHSNVGDCKYKSFNIVVNKEKSNIPVHKLVAYEKYGKRMFGDGILVRHLDGNSLNNNHDNILIGNVYDNRNDIKREVRRTLAINASKKLRRFTDEEVIMIKKDRANGMTYKLLCEKYNTIKSTLSYLFNHASYV